MHLFPLMDTATVHVYPQEVFEHEGWLRLSARVEGLPNAPQTLWFDVEPKHGDLISELGDPFALGILFPALEAELPLHVHGRVSHGLLKNLEYFQAVWQTWLPDRYTPIELSADHEVGAGSVGKHAIAAFSGGLDSAYTVRRHALGMVGRRNLDLKAGLMVLGFDIALEKESSFEGAVEGSRIMLDSLGMELWRLRTNYRRFPADWFFSHGAALAACLHCYAGGCSKGLVASSAPTNSMEGPIGSHVFTDPMLSSPAMEVIHDGGEESRSFKPLVIGDWPEGMAHLRVCWETDHPDSNCGICKKCVRTKIAFLVNGLPVPASLSPPPTHKQINALRFELDWEFRHARRLLRIAKQNGLGGEWYCTALRECVRRSSLRRLLSRVGMKA